MPPLICPHLGLQNDRETFKDFADPENCCHNVLPTTAVRPVFQGVYCLYPRHSDCPIYKHKIAVSIERYAAAEIFQPASTKKDSLALPASIVGLMIFILLLGYQLKDPFLAFANPSEKQKPPTPTQISLVREERPAVTVLPPHDQPIAGSSYSTIAAPPVAIPQPVQVCIPPAGWEVYQVSLTDSLYRLSLIYQVSIEQLRAANCLVEDQLLLPGQQIYVPVLPTVTPTPLPSPTSPPTNTPPTVWPTRTYLPTKRTPTPTSPPATTTSSPLPTSTVSVVNTPTLAVPTSPAASPPIPTTAPLPTSLPLPTP